MPGDGLYLSGLGSFASRTCYANSSGDHLVREPPSVEHFGSSCWVAADVPGGSSRLRNLVDTPHAGAHECTQFASSEDGALCACSHALKAATQ